jgi:hypothetical protein
MCAALEAAPERAQHALRLRGLRLFSSAPDAQRLRRPTDVLLILVGLVLLVPPTLAAPGPTRLDTAIRDVLRHLGGLWDLVWTIGYAFLAFWPLPLALVALACRGRRRLLLDWLVADVLAAGLAIFIGWLGGTSSSSSLTAITSVTPPAVFVAARLALTTAILVAASPHLSRPWRIIGRILLSVGRSRASRWGSPTPSGHWPVSQWAWSLARRRTCYSALRTAA